MGLANALLQLDQANRDQNLNIGPVAMEYRDANGDPVIVVATEESQISAFAAGQISREELLAGTEVDLSSILGGVEALSGAAGQ